MYISFTKGEVRTLFFLEVRGRQRAFSVSAGSQLSLVPNNPYAKEIEYNGILHLE